MNDKMSKTSICSIVALEIIDCSKKTKAEQAEIKNLFDGFISHAVIDIPQEDRVIVDTASGATIACSGPLEDALEDALFISITIRDEILKSNAHNSMHLYVQFGINLGAASVVKNALAGEGVDEAQHIMSFANANQILVSNVYFEMASKLTQEMAQMFEKYELHAHEYDVYAVRLLKAADSPSIPVDTSEFEAAHIAANKMNWKYVGFGFLVLAVIYVLTKLLITPPEPTITMVQPAVVEKPVEKLPVKEEAVAETPPTLTAVPATETKPVEESAKKAKVTQKKSQQKATEEVKPATDKPLTTHAETPVAPTESKESANTTNKHVEPKVEKDPAKDKSGWDTFKDSVKQGSERKCSQAEISMNQCNK
jgi:hypothetical protein